MIFPAFKDKKFGYLNLTIEGEKWLSERSSEQSVEQKSSAIIDQEDGKANSQNPLIDPMVCEQMVNDVHVKYGLDFSYGGWMEDRSILWRGSYLEDSQGFIHLGIDMNAPAGTQVSTGVEGKVIFKDDDFPLDGGWGPHIVIKLLDKPYYLIYAHLDRDILCNVGDLLKADDVFAKVGTAPHNGNWFPHIHIQTIEEKYYDEMHANGVWDAFDGYGKSEDMAINAKRHPDPLAFIDLK